MTWLSFLMGFGINPAIKKRLSEGKSDRHVFAGAALQSVLFLLVTGGILVFKSQFNAYVGADVTEYVVLLLLTTNLLNIVRHVLEGKNLVHISGFLKPSDTILRNLSQVMVVFFGFGLTGMLVGYAVGSFVAGLLGLWFVSLKVKRPTSEEFEGIVSYAKYAWLGGIRSRVFSWIDVTVLGLFVSSTLVGVYQVAWLVGSFFAMFGTAISRTLFPVISNLSTNDSYERVGELMTSSLSFSGLFLIPGFVGAFLLGDLVLTLYGAEFSQGTEILTILIVAHFLYTFQRQFSSALNAVNRPDLAFRVNGSFVGINVVLNFVFISQIGWVGAALASLLSACICLVLGFIMMRRIVTFSLEEPCIEILKQLTAAAAMGVVVYFLRQQLGDALVPLIVMVTSGGMVYFLVLLAISGRFRHVVARNAPVGRIPNL
jgi:O-antigen/teichoic acid export membrane protein